MYVLGGLAIVALLIWWLAHGSGQQDALKTAEGLHPIPGAEMCDWERYKDRVEFEKNINYSKGAVVVIPIAEMFRIVGMDVRRKHARQFITLSPVIIERITSPLPGVRPVKDSWFEGLKPSRVTVVPGFVTDFASIPPIVNLFVKRIGKWTRASVLHDHGYYTHEAGNRAFWDWLMLKAMAQDGVGAWKRRMIYWGVRLFGGPAWRAGPKRNTKEWDVHFLVERLAEEHGMQFSPDHDFDWDKDEE